MLDIIIILVLVKILFNQRELSDKIALLEKEIRQLKNPPAPAPELKADIPAPLQESKPPEPSPEPKADITAPLIQTPPEPAQPFNSFGKDRRETAAAWIGGFSLFSGAALAATRGITQPEIHITLSLLLFAGLIFAWLGIKYPFAVGWHRMSGIAVFLLLLMWSASDALPGNFSLAALFCVLSVAVYAVPGFIKPSLSEGKHGLAFPLLVIMAIIAIVVTAFFPNPFANIFLWPGVFNLTLAAALLSFFAGSLWLGLGAAAAVLVFFSQAFRLAGGNALAPVSLLAFTAAALAALAAFVLYASKRKYPQNPGFFNPPVFIMLSAVLPYIFISFSIAQIKPSNPVAGFSLTLLATAALWTAARLFNAQYAAPAAALGAVAPLYAWHAAAFGYAGTTTPFVWYGLFFVVLFSAPFVFGKHFRNTKIPWLASAVAGPLVFPLFYAGFQSAGYYSFHWLYCALFAACELAALGFVFFLEKEETEFKRNRVTLYGAAAAFFAVSAVILHF
ncbi:MAG: hypothetical protein WCS77_03040 [Elusimicrobiaceae bacterium]|jgi:hypothetical protein